MLPNKTCSSFSLRLYGSIKSKKDALSETILFHYERGNMYYVCTFCVKVASFGGLNIDSLGIRATAFYLNALFLI